MLMAECWWRDTKGNSFYAQVDGGEPTMLGNEERFGRWQWITGPTWRLSPGEHTVTLLGREDGARVAGIVLTNVTP